MIERARFVRRVAPGFIPRLRLEEEQKTEQRRRERWPANWGWYQESELADRPKRRIVEKKGDVELKGMEVFYKNLISKMLETDPVKPVIFCDLGGMYGISAISLALWFKDEVEQGRLVVVVSNLAFIPRRDFQPWIFDGEAKNEQIRQGRDLVRFVTRDTHNLGQVKVPTCIGEISLADNIDIINESMSVTVHSGVPEWDLDPIPELLSSRGIYAVERGNPEGLVFTDPKVIKKYPNIQDQRRQGAQIARQTFIRKGLREVGVAQGGKKKNQRISRIIYKKSEAPEIIVN